MMMTLSCRLGRILMKRSLSNCHLTHGCFSTVSDKSGLFSSTKLNDFPSNIPWDSSMPISTSTANQSEITKLKVNSAVKRFQKHDGDTGSAAVQIAVMTEKIMNLARHFTTHKKDKHSERGFQILLARRKKMMQYMKRRDFEGYKATVKSLKLEREASHI